MKVLRRHDRAETRHVRAFASAEDVGPCSEIGAHVERRGHRLEVDNPTEWQRRNQRWLANHPQVTCLVGAAIFAGVGVLFADLADVSWLLGILLSAGYGGVLGWGFSIDNQGSSPSGLTKVVYGFCIVVGITGLIAFKAMT